MRGLYVAHISAVLVALLLAGLYCGAAAQDVFTLVLFLALLSAFAASSLAAPFILVRKLLQRSIPAVERKKPRFEEPILPVRPTLRLVKK